MGVYAWTVDNDPAVVVHVGATGLPPVVRSWLHVHDDNPDIGRIRAQHPELLCGDVTIRAFQIRSDLDRRAVKNFVVAELTEPTTSPNDATAERRCAQTIAAHIRVRKD